MFSYFSTGVILGNSNCRHLIFSQDSKHACNLSDDYRTEFQIYLLATSDSRIFLYTIAANISVGNYYYFYYIIFFHRRPPPAPAAFFFLLVLLYNIFSSAPAACARRIFFFLISLSTRCPHLLHLYATKKTSTGNPRLAPRNELQI